jgi:4-amino-4-deoxy-L-arabinose transferase-like glycosyltransferase
MYRALLSDPRVWLVLALAVLLAGVFVLPLWLPEILQLMATTRSSFPVMLNWIKATPHAAPLGYFTQFSLIAILGHSAWAARLPSVVFALGSCYLLWRLAKGIGIQQPILALVLFLLLPIQYRFAVEATVFEEALFFSIVAALGFRTLVEAPTVANAGRYALALTLCLYTEPLSFLPATGYMLFVLAFIVRKEMRMALWHILPATALPVLLYAPYFAWTRTLKLPYWLLAADTYSILPSTWPMLFRDLTGGGDVGYVLTAMVLVGAVVATWRAVRLTEPAHSKRVALFYLLGGVVSTVIIVLILDNQSELPFSPSQFLWAAPGLIILLTAALDWVAAKNKYLAYTLAALFIGFSVAGDYTLLTTRTENVAKLTALVAPELQGDTCVVFLSEGRLTHEMFFVFDPNLRYHECRHFSHHRILLLSHPYVRPDQQRDGETYFRGLDFIETKRIAAGDGLLLVLDQKTE